MIGNNLLGIIFANEHEECLSEMTDVRTIGSVPFCGRYRLIDFPLSFMVDSGMTKIGVVTGSNFQSLMYHLGTGNPWDLSRKTNGLYILPPFSAKSMEDQKGRIHALNGITSFLTHSNQEYVVMSDCNTVCNLDLGDMFKKYKSSGADILIGYKHGALPKNINQNLAFNLDDNKRIIDAVVSPTLDGEYNYSLNFYIIKKSLLLTLVHDAVSRNMMSFEKDIIQRNIDEYKIFGYEIQDYSFTIDSLVSYYKANMDILSSDVRSDVFRRERPIYTKVKDDMPAKYGLGSSVKNSLIADGCIIDGEVENSVLFRGVRVEKGAKIKNSIVMQSSFIGENVTLNCVILDKEVVIKPDVALSGAPTFPIYIKKASII